MLQAPCHPRTIKAGVRHRHRAAKANRSVIEWRAPSASICKNSDLSLLTQVQVSTISDNRRMSLVSW